MRVIPLVEQHFISVVTCIGTQLGVQMVDLVISCQQHQAAAFHPKTKTVKFVTLASLKSEINLNVKMFPAVRKVKQNYLIGMDSKFKKVDLLIMTEQRDVAKVDGSF